MLDTVAPPTGSGTQITADSVLTEAVARYGDDFGPQELADTYESMQNSAAKLDKGVFYTPQPVADFMSRFALDIQLGQMGPEPEQVLRICAVEPACGAGIILVSAARYLAAQYAGRLVGANPTQALVDAVLPTVILECVFGVELDPVAAELSRIALSRETGGTLTPQMLERHVIAGNTLDNQVPPALTDKMGAPPAELGVPG